MTAAARYASVRARQRDVAAGRGWRSGFCGLDNPADSHDRCTGTNGTSPCVCACHQPPASEERTDSPTVPAAAPDAATHSPAPVSPLQVGPGVHADFPEPEYHAHPALSSSGAKLLVPPSVPALYRYWTDHPRPDRAVFDLGHAAHLLVLGVGAPIERIEADDWRTKAAREARDETRTQGRTPVLAADHDRVIAMAAKIRAHPIAGRLFDPDRGKPEQTLFWTDEETGVPRRARLDWLPDPGRGRLIVTDLKTTRSANPATFGKAAADFGYFMQHPWYLDAVEACGLAQDPAFVFVLVEKEPPHLVSVVELDVDAVRLGRNLNRRAIATYSDCTATDTWPGYSTDVELVSLPSWFTYRHNTEDY